LVSAVTGEHLALLSSAKRHTRLPTSAKSHGPRPLAFLYGMFDGSQGINFCESKLMSYGGFDLLHNFAF
jgi:hypothetical protein